jgi:hypothetical protein
MWTVVFERGGEAVARFHTHASSEADAQAQALAFFHNCPKEDPFAGNYDGIVMRVEKTGHAQGSDARIGRLSVS